MALIQSMIRSTSGTPPVYLRSFFTVSLIRRTGFDRQYPDPEYAPGAIASAQDLPPGGTDLLSRGVRNLLPRITEKKTVNEKNAANNGRTERTIDESTMKAKVANLLTHGNKKVGESVLVFNLPVFDTCPGQSATCRTVCYADRGHCRWPRNRQRNVRNLAASQQPDFVERVVGQLSQRDARLARLHSSGDFYAPEYVRRWVEIAARLPGVTFWGYTRSWRLPPLLSELERLAELPNVELWFSCDLETGLPPLVQRVRACWLQVGDEMPPRPRAGQAPVELVFRTRRAGRTAQKRIGLTLVCPTYSGMMKGSDTTCERCGVCWAQCAPEKAI
jgi:hypothetical protein